MRKVNFAGTGTEVSCAALGTMLMGTVLNKADSFSILDDFIDKGGNFIDTANCYAWWCSTPESYGDESENLLGEWMSERKNRDKIFLSTKFGGRLSDVKKVRNPDGSIIWENVVPTYEGSSEKVIRAGIEGSLKRLKTDYIDLYYVHVDDRSTPLEETLGVLAELVKEGKVKHIGCSNMRTWRIATAKEICKNKNFPFFKSIQQEYSYIRQNMGAQRNGVAFSADTEMFDFIKANPDMTLVAYSPLLKGIYSDEQKRKSYYDWSMFNNGESLERIQVIEKMSKELGITGNQLVLAWILNTQPSIIPILGFSKVSQCKENMDALSIKLTDEQMTILNNGRY